MGLVDYSDSETSDSTPAPTIKAKTSTKAGFEKVVDRSNPHKIRVQLPQLSNEGGSATTTNDDEPPAKKLRTGGGAFSGFNSMLPAPKRSGPAAGGGISHDKGRGKGGLGSGVSLKTGAEPAFERRAISDTGGIGMQTTAIPLKERVPVVKEDDSKPPSLPQDESPSGPALISSTVTPGSQPPKKSTMFKPLSVARKAQKKRAGGADTTSLAPVDVKKPEVMPPPAPRPSLFSIGQAEQLPSAAQSDGDYKTMIYETSSAEVPANAFEDISPDLEEGEFKNANLPPETQSGNTTSTAGPTTTLDSIAKDLGLDDNAKRQLFGRQKGSGRQDQGQSAIKIINFSTDQEYAANEALRAAGETVQHNPVKAIAPGKHNLKQLVSAVSNQREALEEHFATGRRNKKEAGSRYGW
ncbi:MAG: hypothetical protein M1823_002697 [Watsoniomyces obsoletus]|nr:MAG: hypothetical protein M1823_002697 [Watsoniomyces obsoletus]